MQSSARLYSQFSAFLAGQNSRLRTLLLPPRLTSLARASLCIALLVSILCCDATAEYLVSDEVAKLKRGELTLDDFTVSTLEKLETTPELLKSIGGVISELPGIERIAAPLLRKKANQKIATLQGESLEGFRSVVEIYLQNDKVALNELVSSLDLALTLEGLLKDSKPEEVVARVNGVTNSDLKQALVEHLLLSFNSQVDSALEESDLNRVLDWFAKFAQLSKTEKLVSAATVPLKRLLEKSKTGGLTFVGFTLDSPEQIAFLRRVVKSNNGLKEPLAELFEQRLRFLIDQDIADRLSDCYAILLEFRPDPDARNEKLKVWTVLNGDGGLARDFATGRLQELKYSGALSPITRFRILMKGYYGRALPYVFIGAVVVALLTAVLIVIRPMFVDSVADVMAKAEIERANAAARREKTGVSGATTAKPTNPRSMVGEESIQRGGIGALLGGKQSYVPGYLKGPVEEDEYSKLLARFGLDDSASEADIKKAYREQMKSLHPDTQQEKPPGGGDGVDFMESKEVYDRIMQIRSSWFGARK